MLKLIFIDSLRLFLIPTSTNIVTNYTKNLSLNQPIFIGPFAVSFRVPATHGTSQLPEKTSAHRRASTEEHEETPLWAQYLHSVKSMISLKKHFWGDLWRCETITLKKMLQKSEQISMKTGIRFHGERLDTSGRRKNKTRFQLLLHSCFNLQWGKLPDKKPPTSSKTCDLRNL